MIVIWQKIVAAMAELVHAIPVPEWLTNVGVYEIPPLVSWALNGINISAGVAIIASAYVIRFTIRRIPIIG